MHLRKDGSGLYSNRHSVFLLSYHLVLVTRYRKPVMIGEVAEWMRGYIESFLVERGVRVRALEVVPDYVHVLFDAPPQVQLSDFVKSLKTGSSRRVRSTFPDEVGRFYCEPMFWSKSYFICTVSDKSAKNVQHYIEHQKD